MAELPEGYGSIYCTSWWGEDGRYQRYVDEGVIIAGVCVPLYTTLYKERVEADGGVVEALSCLSDALEALGYNDANYNSEKLANAYDVRIVADSGTLEAKTCVEQNLKNILL